MAFMTNCILCWEFVPTVLAFRIGEKIGIATTTLSYFHLFIFDALFQSCSHQVNAAPLSHTEFLLQQNLSFVYCFL